MTTPIPPLPPESAAPPGQPAAPYPAAAPMAPARPTSTMAVVSLVSGLVSWVLLPLLAAIVAIITGHMGRSEIRRSNGALDGDGMAVAGLILGYLQIGLLIITILGFILFFGGLAAILALAQ
jgi:hypothetical protein